MRRLTRRFGGDERGQALVVVAIAIALLALMGAFAIDVSNWYQRHHQAQLAADAAALAAANCLANGGSGQTCTSAADTTGADNVATTYAGANGVPLSSTNQVSVNGTTVTVTETTGAPSLLAGVAGIANVSPTATAVAASTPSSSGACVVAGSNCYAIFAMDTACPASPSSTNTPVVFNGSSDNVNGGVHSNGSINLIGGSQTLGPTTYSNGTGCQVKQGGSGDTFSSGPTAEAPILTWPDDYSQVLTACGGSGQPSCTGPGGTPSYCTKAQASYDFNDKDTLVTGKVWCAYGTGTPSNPATWNGLIYFQDACCGGTLGTSSTPIYGTWIGGTIQVGHQSFLSVQSTTPTYPLFYALGSGTCSSQSVGGICMQAAVSTVTGALFAPNGTVQFNGAGSTANFLEGKDVNLVGGTFNGDGPGLGSSSGFSSGTVVLEQ